MTNTESKQDRVRRIIKALLAKTTANGATEDEAMEALTKAKELMDRYQVEIGAEAVLEEGITKGGYRYKEGPVHLFCRYISMSLADYLEVRVVRQIDNKTITFVGFESDVRLAEWMMEALVDFVMNGAKAYVNEELRKLGGAKALHNPTKLRNGLRNSYARGAGLRIHERLAEMIKARNAARIAHKQSTGTDLVVFDKAKLVTNEFNALFPRTRTGSSRRAKVHNGAYAAGKARGDAAQFHRPVGAGGNLMIGR